MNIGIVERAHRLVVVCLLTLAAAHAHAASTTITPSYAWSSPLLPTLNAATAGAACAASFEEFARVVGWYAVYGSPGHNSGWDYTHYIGDTSGADCVATYWYPQAGPPKPGDTQVFTRVSSVATCPVNSTKKTLCVCDSGFIADASATACVRGCTTDSSCDDKDFCNGTETCDAVAGCVAGPKPSCDDGVACTEDRCDPLQNKCVHKLAPAQCTCDALPLPPIETGGKIPFPTFEADCPTGGRAGLGLDVGLKVSSTMPTCDNGCLSSDTGEVSVKAEAKSCSQSVGTTVTGKVSRKEERCPECNAQTCKQGCGAGACVEQSGSGSVALSRDWFKTFGKSMNVPPYFQIQCGVQGGVSLETELSFSTKENQGACSSCADCSTLKSTLTGTATGSGSCKLGPVKGAKSNMSACVACAEMKLTEKGGATGKWGACGNESCPFVNVGIEGKAKFEAKLSYKYWEMGGECAAAFTGCSEANACGTCTCPGCRDWSGDAFSCKVTNTFKLPGLKP